MGLLKTHSHTSERPGCEGRKSAEKEIERNAVNIIRPPVKNLPRTASVAGTRDEKGVMARQTTVKTLPRAVSGVGGEDDERRIEEHMREDKRNQHQNPPAGYHRGRRARQKAKTNTKGKCGTTRSPARGVSAYLKTHKDKLK